MKAYVDGACKGNGAVSAQGGWAVIFEDGREYSGHLSGTTSNLAELTAVQQAIRLFQPEMGKLVIVTDSQNVIGWLSQGWKRKHPRIAEKCRFIEELSSALAIHLEFEKVQGHAGHILNERADRLASLAS